MSIISRDKLDFDNLEKDNFKEISVMELYLDLLFKYNQLQQENAELRKEIEELKRT